MKKRKHKYTDGRCSLIKHREKNGFQLEDNRTNNPVRWGSTHMAPLIFGSCGLCKYGFISFHEEEDIAQVQ